jgi:hypothetical protein
MKSQTFFIVPHGTTSWLTDEGWVFASRAPLSTGVLQKVIEHFRIPFVEEFLGIQKFQNEQTQVNAVFDDQGGLTEIYLCSQAAGLLEQLHRLLAGESVDILDTQKAKQET